MLGTLNQSQIDKALQSQLIGRIGCYADNQIYVVPVTYAYDGAYIYAHTTEGMKVRMMRKNPQVCFEVDMMENLANWQSVIAWGRYEEMNDPAMKAEGMKILMDRLMPMMARETTNTPHHAHAATTTGIIAEAIVYRIKVEVCTGRFEKQ